jgi:hypothetical protein
MNLWHCRPQEWEAQECNDTSTAVHHLHQHQRKSGITGNTTTTIMANSLQGLQRPSLSQHEPTNKADRHDRTNRGRAQECQSRNNTTKSGTTGSITGVPEHHRSASAHNYHRGSRQSLSPHKLNNR